jgi:Uri superfamily endonuclease
MKGLYTLLIHVLGNMTVQTRGAIFTLRCGIYVYIGSAMGPHAHALEDRISRHLRVRKKSHWHVDYILKPANSIVKGVVYAQSREKLECKLASRFTNQSKPVIPIDGFGCSDCKCKSHLLLLRGWKDPLETLRMIEKIFKSLGLSPVSIPLKRAEEKVNA